MNIPFRSSFYSTCLFLLAGLASAGEVVTYYHSDVVGSPIAATDVYGQVAWRSSYEPYGERIQSAADHLASANNVRWFTGHVQDVETDLVYMQSRYYDPLLGRFMGADPVGVVAGVPQSFNRYAYAWNNPYKYNDPDGEFANFIIGGVKGAIENVVIQTVEIKLGLRQEFSYSELAGDAALGTVTSGLSTVRNAERLSQITAKVADNVSNIVRNRAQGKAAERIAREALENDGYTILGEQVTIRTSNGRRVADMLVEKDGQRMLIEVKSGGATRSSAQRAKDELIEKGEGVIVGKNAPDLIGSTEKLKTVEINIPVTTPK